MSSISSQVSAASASGSNEQECEPSPSASATPSASECCESTGQLSLFTTTCEPSPQRALWPTPTSSDATGGPRPPDKKRGPSPGLRWSAAASPARTSPSLARELDWRALDRAYGQSTPELLAKFDPDTLSWRTQQLCLDGALQQFSETWPRSGLMRNGTAYLLPPLVRLTDETELGLLPMPTAGDAKDSGSRNTPSSKAHPGVSLTDAIRADGGTGRMWPTPTTRDAETPKKAMRGRGSLARGQEWMPPLAVAVTMWPTPTAKDGHATGTMGRNAQGSPPLRQMVASPAARDWRSGRGRSENGHTPQLPEQVGGQLNPTWVEWLMGLPLGWTVVSGSSPSATPSSPTSSSSSDEQS
jgi:hypothetical protein